MKRFLLLLVISLLVSSTTVLAEIDLLGKSIVKTYSAGETIKGIINVSFDDEPAFNQIHTNFNGSVALISFLEKNGYSAGIEYNCSISSCATDYTVQGEMSSTSLSEGQLQAGLKVSGQEISDIVSLHFSISSSAGPSCVKQLTIFPFNLTDYPITNQKYTPTPCFTKQYGCFDQSLGAYDEATITAAALCENITLPAAAGYLVGAHVKNSSTQATGLEMQLYSIEGDYLAKCGLPANTLVNSFEERNCIVNYSSSIQQQYLVCVKAVQSGSNYLIRSETSSPRCGTDDLGDSFDRDYELFGQPLMFDSVNISVNESTFQQLYGESLSGLAETYLDENYLSYCDPYCVLPFSFASGIDQEITVKSATISYKDGNTLLGDDALYEIESEEPTLSSGPLTLDLALGEFSIPIGSTSSILKILIGEKTVAQETISISKSFDFDIGPKFVGFGSPTTFSITSSSAITSATWNFGDGSSTQVGVGKTIQHTYTQQGSFTVVVEATRNDGVKGKKTFSIAVGDPKTVANTTIKQYYSRITTLQKQIDSYPAWIKQAIEKKVDLVLLNASIASIENNYIVATSDEEYQAVVLDLLALAVPEGINVTKKSPDLPLLIGAEGISVSPIIELSGTTVTNNEEVKSKVLSWMGTNYDAKISFEQISFVKEGSLDTILTRFTINTYPKMVESQTYLIIGYPVDTLTFATPGKERSIGQSTYFELGQENEAFSFIVDGEVEPQNLGAYISPAVQQLGSIEGFATCNLDKKCDRLNGETRENCPNDCRPWAAFWVLIVFLALGALIIYIVLQEWYKRRYEKHLFPRQEDLYNIINFIYNSRRSGIDDHTIKEKLKETGWNGEQISYTLHKIDGKRTGMYEIPLFKFVENRRVREELAKRQEGGVVDARFIKRPSF